MPKTEYAYAVARVRANELTLLSNTDIEQLIAASDYAQAIRLLVSKGCGETEDDADYSEYLLNHMDETWELLKEVMDDIHKFDMLVIRNDMQNLKAALKCIISRQDPKNLLITPTVYDTEEILKKVENRRFDLLPECMQAAACEAYDILVRTGMGQYADIILDRATLETVRSLGRQTKSEILDNLSELMCVTSNIKTALRCSYTHKDINFLQRSISDCDTLNKKYLISAASESTEALLDYLSATDYCEAAEKIKIGTWAFEKWCDDVQLQCIEPAKYRPFGIEPLAAYYIAKKAEIKTVSIILSAKINHLPEEKIKQRVRTLYV